MKHHPRFFLYALASITLASCSAELSPPLPPTSPVAITAPIKSVANTEYRTPTPSAPAPRNPDTNFSSTPTSASSVTYSRVSVPGPYVALTFDDGPHASNTPRLLDILRSRNVKATFYVIGKNVDMYPNIVRRTVAEGHEIGNHTYNHPKLSSLSSDRIISEITRTDDAISRAAGVRPRTLRPPYGALLQTQRTMVKNKLGHPTIMWSVDPLDWKRPGPAVVTSRILTGTTNGAIILAHDLHAPTVDAMPATIDGLLRKGYRFVTVSQLIAMGKTTPTP